MYLGELKSVTKAINLEEEDSEEAHLNLEAQKVIKFEHASRSHQSIVSNQILNQDSVVGKLMTGAAQQEG